MSNNFDIHVSTLSNNWDLYRYTVGETFCYRVRDKDANSDIRVNYSGFTAESKSDIKVLDSFMTHYMEDTIKHKDGCLFTSSDYNVSNSFWH